MNEWIVSWKGYTSEGLNKKSAYDIAKSRLRCVMMDNAWKFPQESIFVKIYYGQGTATHVLNELLLTMLDSWDATYRKFVVKDLMKDLDVITLKPVCPPGQRKEDDPDKGFCVPLGLYKVRITADAEYEVRAANEESAIEAAETAMLEETPFRHEVEMLSQEYTFSINASARKYSHYMPLAYKVAAKTAQEALYKLWGDGLDSDDAWQVEGDGIYAYDDKGVCHTAIIVDVL